MRRIRVIPVLLIQNGRLVKSVQFKDHKYVGDPINAVKIFNEKEVDEIIILDISATQSRQVPDIQRIAEIAGEAFMPLGYGGGITTVEQVKKILYEGAEKVIINATAHQNPTLITQTSETFGSQSMVVSIDAKKDWLGKYRVFQNCGQKNSGIPVVEFAQKMEALGAGEIMLTSISRDGVMKGYDLELTKMVTQAVNIPVIACGGASNVNDFLPAVKDGGASAVAAGSMFVFQGPHKAVLISYPSQEELKTNLFQKI